MGHIYLEEGQGEAQKVVQVNGVTHSHVTRTEVDQVQHQDSSSPTMEETSASVIAVNAHQEECDRMVDEVFRLMQSNDDKASSKCIDCILFLSVRVCICHYSCVYVDSGRKWQCGRVWAASTSPLSTACVSSRSKSCPTTRRRASLCSRTRRAITAIIGNILIFPCFFLTSLIWSSYTTCMICVACICL